MAVATTSDVVVGSTALRWIQRIILPSVLYEHAPFIAIVTTPYGVIRRDFSVSGRRQKTILSENDDVGTCISQPIHCIPVCGWWTRRRRRRCHRRCHRPRHHPRHHPRHWHHPPPIPTHTVSIPLAAWPRGWLALIVHRPSSNSIICRIPSPSPCPPRPFVCHSTHRHPLPTSRVPHPDHPVLFSLSRLVPMHRVSHRTPMPPALAPATAPAPAPAPAPSTPLSVTPTAPCRSRGLRHLPPVWPTWSDEAAVISDTK